MTRRRYGLQRDRRWLLPPAMNGAKFSDDPRAAWAAFDLDAVLARQLLLRQAFGIATIIRSIPNG